MSTLKEIRDIILKKADEDPLDVEQYIIDVINKAINDAYLEVCIKKNLLMQKDTVNLDSENMFLTSSLTKPLNKIIKIVDLNNRFDIPFVEIETGKFYVTPITNPVVVHYSYIPTKLSLDGDILLTSPNYDNVMVYKGLVDYYMLNRKMDLATIYLQLYNQEINKIDTYKGGDRKFKIRWDLL